MMAKAGYTLLLFGILLYFIGAYILIEEKGGIWRLALFTVSGVYGIIVLSYLLILIWV